jgi:serine/threonine protein phosphatase 1
MSDIHGCYNTFIALCKKIPRDYSIVCAGDLIDRGKRSKDVIQTIIDKKYPTVMGNHDFFMIDERNLKLTKKHNLWWENGGESTLRSYGGKWKITNDPKYSKVFKKHKNFIQNLPIILKFPNIKVNNREVWVSHSPLDLTMQIAMTPEILERVLKTCDRTYALANPNSPEGLVVQNAFWRHWDFGKKMGYPKDNFPFFNVTGHTSLTDVHIDNHFACVDTWVYGPNKLSALLLPDLRVIEQKFIEDTWELKKIKK